jgi:hypothetical protein
VSLNRHLDLTGHIERIGSGLHGERGVGHSHARPGTEGSGGSGGSSSSPQRPTTWSGCGTWRWPRDRERGSRSQTVSEPPDGERGSRSQTVSEPPDEGGAQSPPAVNLALKPERATPQGRSSAAC